MSTVERHIQNLELLQTDRLQVYLETDRYFKAVDASIDYKGRGKLILINQRCIEEELQKLASQVLEDEDTLSDNSLVNYGRTLSDNSLVNYGR